MTARSHSAFCIRILLMTFGALYFCLTLSWGWWIG
jgi:hypothetical protein